VVASTVAGAESPAPLLAITLPIHAAADEFAGLALDDGATPGADVVVAILPADGADAGIRAGVGDLRSGIEFHKRVPKGKFVVVIDIVEKSRR
jgi:hypothetical protein